VYNYTYDIRLDNLNGRTLEGLSVHAKGTMKKGGGIDCDACPYIDDYQVYLDYYGDTDYANIWFSSASYNKSTTFSSGHGMADFSEFRFRIALAEAMAKGSVLLNVWMFVVHELEGAISDCEKGCGIDECNDDHVHSLDAAMAFYAGSREGEDGSGDGKFMYDLADRQAAHFRTAGEFGTEEQGTAFANLQVVREFKKAQIFLLQGECERAKDNKEMIVNNMKVPLVQGVLRAAYMRQYENPVNPENVEQLEAEGATYAAAILPYLHKCNNKDAQTVYQNMRVGSSASKVVFSDVKAAFENNYDCMGIACEDVGGIWTVNGYSDHAKPCGKEIPTGSSYVATSSSDGGGSAAANSSASKAAMVAGLTVTIIFAAFLAIFLLVRSRNKSKLKRRKDRTGSRRSSNIAAVNEIS